MNLLFGFTAGLTLLVRTVFTESGPKSGRRSRETILVSQVDLGHLAIVRRMSPLQFFCTYWPCQLNATTMRTKTGAIVDPCCFPEIYVNSYQPNVSPMADAPDSESGLLPGRSRLI